MLELSAGDDSDLVGVKSTDGLLLAIAKSRDPTAGGIAGETGNEVTTHDGRSMQADEKLGI